jgi:hypothetical protein
VSVRVRGVVARAGAAAAPHRHSNSNQSSACRGMQAAALCRSSLQYVLLPTQPIDRPCCRPGSFCSAPEQSVAVHKGEPRRT